MPEFLAAGKSAVVYGLDDTRILKEYYNDEYGDAAVEKRAFARLGPHRHIVRCLDWPEGDKCVVLERGQPLRKLLRGGGPLPMSKTRARWIHEAALGLDHVHACGIVHADVGCHNMVLVDDCVKLIDFEGCSIDDAEPTSFYEWFSSRKRSIPSSSSATATKETDIFAFSCAMYEIMTGTPPHADLVTETDRQPQNLAQDRYARNEFPNTDDIPLGAVMQQCWRGELLTMGSVLQALENCADDTMSQ